MFNGLKNTLILKIHQNNYQEIFNIYLMIFELKKYLNLIIIFRLFDIDIRHIYFIYNCHNALKK
jgi:hypothetical protein